MSVKFELCLQAISSYTFELEAPLLPRVSEVANFKFPGAKKLPFKGRPPIEESNPPALTREEGLVRTDLTDRGSVPYDLIFG